MRPEVAEPRLDRSLPAVTSCLCSTRACARSLGLSLPNTATCQELFNAAVAAGGEAWDHSAMVRVLERLACHEIGQSNAGK